MAYIAAVVPHPAFTTDLQARPRPSRSACPFHRRCDLFAEATRMGCGRHLAASYGELLPTTRPRPAKASRRAYRRVRRPLSFRQVA